MSEIARASARWIPVSERLPEHSGEVLVYDDCEYSVGTLYRGAAGGPFWLTQARNHDLGGDPKITHWMPLPEPPRA